MYLPINKTEGPLFGVDTDALWKELKAALTDEEYLQCAISGDGVSFPPEAEAIVLAHGSAEAVAAKEQAKLKSQIKEIRATALETFPKNSGIDNVYVLNFQAATLGAADTTTILRNGKTPASHLGDFGAPLGMTAAQFGAYILTENLSAGQKMTEIEGEYLENYYAPVVTEQMVVDFQTFCDVRAS